MSTSAHEPVIASYALASTRTITTDGVTYAYRELGPTGGVPAILFVHLAATLDNWDPRVVDAIAQHRHVIAFDNRGVGASTSDVPDTIEALADDAYTFITAIGFDTIDAFGFSLGGFVVQALVVKHPELIRKIVLTGTGPKGGAGIDEVAAVTYKDTADAMAVGLDPKVLLFFNHDEQGRASGGAFIERLKERTTERDVDISAAAFQTQLAAITAWGRDEADDLSVITQPVLIANGDHDRMVPSALSEDLHQRITGSQLIIYPESGHGGIFQYHEEFAPVVVTFLGR